MPMLVITMSVNTAGTKYSFMLSLTSRQYSCNHTVTTSLAASRMVPMITMGHTAAANMAVSPMME